MKQYSSLLVCPDKDTYVSLPELERMPSPEPLGKRHRPYRYDEIVTELIEGAKRAGYGVIRNEMVLSRKEKMLLGIMELELKADRVINGIPVSIAIGYRASTHQLTSLKCVAGGHVLMCSNLIMSGDMFVVQRKFTLNLSLASAVDEGFDKFKAQHTDMENALVMMTNYGLKASEAKGIIFDGITKHRLPMSIAREAAKWYFGEEYGGNKITEDCQPRTEWGLYNAFTRSLRDFPALPRFEHTKTLGRIFNL